MVDDMYLVFNDKNYVYTQYSENPLKNQWSYIIFGRIESEENEKSVCTTIHWYQGKRLSPSRLLLYGEKWASQATRWPLTLNASGNALKWLCTFRRSLLRKTHSRLSRGESVPKKMWGWIWVADVIHRVDWSPTVAPHNKSWVVFSSPTGNRSIRSCARTILRILSSRRSILALWSPAYLTKPKISPFDLPPTWICSITLLLNSLLSFQSLSYSCYNCQKDPLSSV